MVKLSAHTVTIPPDNTYPLYVTANRYWVDGNSEAFPSNSSGLTLVLLHATSFHKEQWMPCLERLFDLVKDRESLRVEEAWAIECPNHGESASLNSNRLLLPPFSEQFGILGYSKAVHRFISLRPEFTLDKCRKLVAIGHSAGANVALMIQTFTPLIPFWTVITIEPMVCPGADEQLERVRTGLLHTVRKRRDKWATLEEARMSLPWKDKTVGRRKRWHPTIIELYIKHAVIPVRDSDGKTYFALACTKRQEEIMYLDEQGSSLPLEILDQVSNKLPIHLILGEVKDFISAEGHAKLASTSATGRNWASVTIVPGVGHLIPQERPEALGEIVARLLWDVTRSAILKKNKL